MKLQKVILTLGIMVSTAQLSAVNLNSDLTNRMTPVKHQGGRNTCSAFASTAIMEFLIKQQTGQDIDLSENYIYYNSKAKHLENDYLVGAYRDSDGHAGYLSLESYKFGAMLESEWPYFEKNWEQLNDPRCDKTNPKMECYTGIIPSNAKTLNYKAEAIYVPYNDIPRFLRDEQKPVLVNIMWYVNAADNDGNLRMPTASDLRGEKGGHVVVIVGYNETTDRYIIKNSWGTQWGNNGFGTMPRNYLLQHFEVKPWMEHFDTYHPDVQDMLRKGSMGTSARLISN